MWKTHTVHMLLNCSCLSTTTSSTTVPVISADGLVSTNSSTMCCTAELYAPLPLTVNTFKIFTGCKDKSLFSTLLIYIMSLCLPWKPCLFDQFQIFQGKEVSGWGVHQICSPLTTCPQLWSTPVERRADTITVHSDTKQTVCLKSVLCEGVDVLWWAAGCLLSSYVAL